MQLDIIHERLGGDSRVDSLGVPKLAYPYVFNSIDDEGAAGAFRGFVQLEIVPNRFVDGIGAGGDN